MSKLVRDRIPEIIQKEGGTPSFRACGSGELFDLLRDKLIEEAGELRCVKNRADAYEEMADVLEVVDALRATYDPEHLAQVRELKALTKGRFTKGYVLD